MNKKIIYFSFFLLFSVFNFGSYNLDLLVLFLSFFVIYFIVSYRCFPVSALPIFFILFFVSLFFLYHGFFDISAHAYYLLRILRSFLFFLVVYYIIKRFELSFNEVFYSVVFILSVHVFVSIGQFLFSGELKDFFLSLSPASDENLVQRDVIDSIRVRGLTSGFDVSGIMTGFLFLMLAYVHRSNYIFLFLFFLVFIFLTFMSSRVGILTVLFSVLFVLLFFYRFSFFHF